MSLWQTYQSRKAEKNRLYFPREGAADLGVSEGELMADAPSAVFLGGDIAALLPRLEDLGKVECIVRNSLAVHEKQGHYANLRLGVEGGIAVNPGGIDVRISLKNWHAALAVAEENGGTVSRSIQFYDPYGGAVQKVFLREEGREAVWQTLLDDFGQAGKPQFRLPENTVADTALLAEEHLDAFRREWLELQDVHQFGAVLQRFGIGRQAAYRAAPPGMAVAVESAFWETLFGRVRDSGTEVMIFAGNSGVVQIQRGRIHNLKRAHGYLNILDGREEGFSLHLKDEEIAETWIVRRPMKDGILTCLEGFDSEGRSILQIFGRRSEGQSEAEQWRELFADRLAAQ